MRYFKGHQKERVPPNGFRFTSVFFRHLCYCFKTS